MCCLVVQVFVYACGGFKKKKIEKNIPRSTMAAKKMVEVFVQKIFFRQTVFSL